MPKKLELTDNLQGTTTADTKSLPYQEDYDSINNVPGHAVTSSLALPLKPTLTESTYLQFWQESVDNILKCMRIINDQNIQALLAIIKNYIEEPKISAGKKAEIVKTFISELEHIKTGKKTDAESVFYALVDQCILKGTALNKVFDFTLFTKSDEFLKLKKAILLLKAKTIQKTENSQSYTNQFDNWMDRIVIICDDILNIDSNCVEAYMLKGEMLESLHKIDDAILSFKKLRTLKNIDEKIEIALEFWLGKLYFNEGENKKIYQYFNYAREHFSKAERIYDSNQSCLDSNLYVSAEEFWWHLGYHMTKQLQKLTPETPSLDYRNASKYLNQAIKCTSNKFIIAAIHKEKALLLYYMAQRGYYNQQNLSQEILNSCTIALQFFSWDIELLKIKQFADEQLKQQNIVCGPKTDIDASRKYEGDSAATHDFKDSKYGTPSAATPCRVNASDALSQASARIEEKYQRQRSNDAEKIRSEELKQSLEETSTVKCEDQSSIATQSIPGAAAEFTEARQREIIPIIIKEISTQPEMKIETQPIIKNLLPKIETLVSKYPMGKTNFSKISTTLAAEIDKLSKEMAAMQQELESLRQIPVSKNEDKQKKNELENKLHILWKSHRERQQIIEQQQLILNSDSVQLKTFYIHLQGKLNQELVALHAIASGKVAVSSNLIKGLGLAGSLLNTVTIGISGALAALVTFFQGRGDRKQAQLSVESYVYSITAVEKMVEKVARELTFRYADQIRLLSISDNKPGCFRIKSNENIEHTLTSTRNLGGVHVLAECVAKRILVSIFNGNHSVNQLVEFVFAARDKQGNMGIGFADVTVKTEKPELSKSENWTDTLLYKAGIKVPLQDGTYEYYGNDKGSKNEACARWLKYGFRLGTIEEVITLKLTKVQPFQQKPVPLNASVASPASKATTHFVAKVKEEQEAVKSETELLRTQVQMLRQNQEALSLRIVDLEKIVASLLIAQQSNTLTQPNRLLIKLYN